MPDQQKRLDVLRDLLARLTGEEGPRVDNTTPSSPTDPRERRLQVLRAMLARLGG